jgi:dTDP-4-amino-4,6-dideoxygalactose transaminase
MRAAMTCLSLPMFPELTTDQQIRTVEALRQAVQCFALSSS